MSDPSIADMISTLSKDGIFILKDYLKGDDLKNLYLETLRLCTSEAGHYEFGRNYRGPPLNKFSASSSISKTFNTDWMKKLSKEFPKGTGTFGHNVFATHDYIPNKNLARNGWLHFDRIWCLKFLIYLNDVTDESGAFHCSVGSVKCGEKLRKSAWKVKDYANVKNRIELDYKELLEEYKPTPIEGKAGTLIIFDTDAFHKGGIIRKEGSERILVRLHCK